MMQINELGNQIVRLVNTNTPKPYQGEDEMNRLDMCIEEFKKCRGLFYVSLIDKEYYLYFSERKDNDNKAIYIGRWMGDAEEIAELKKLNSNLNFAMNEVNRDLLGKMV